MDTQRALIEERWMPRSPVVVALLASTVVLAQRLVALQHGLDRRATRADPWVIRGGGMIEPEPHARDVAHMRHRGERTHAALLVRVVGELALGVTQPIFVRRGERDAIAREHLHAEPLMRFFALHLGLVMEMAVGAKLVLPWFLDVTEEHDEQKIREGKGSGRNATKRS